MALQIHDRFLVASHFAADYNKCALNAPCQITLSWKLFRTWTCFLVL